MGKLQKPMIFESKVSADPFERTVQLGNTAERLGAVAEEIEIISTMPSAPQLMLGLAPRPCEPSGAGRRRARRPEWIAAPRIPRTV
jgi:hypothetical protein